MKVQLLNQPTMGATAWMLLLLLSLLWGGSFFFSEIALRELQPLTVVFVRVSIAAIALLPVVYLSGYQMPRSPKIWRAFFIMGALNNVIPFSLIVWGQTHIESSLAAILNATTPLFGVILAHFLTRDERLTANRLLGVLLGVGGVTILVGPEVLRGLNWQGLGQFAVLGAALSYSVAGIYGKRFRSLPSVVAAAGMVTSSAIMMLPLALLTEHPWTASPTAITVVALLSLGLFCTTIAYLIYFHILAIAGATNLLLVTFLIPVSALLLGVLILDEPLSWIAIAGMALIFAGLAAIAGRLFPKQS